MAAGGTGRALASAPTGEPQVGTMQAPPTSPGSTPRQPVHAVLRLALALVLAQAVGIVVVGLGLAAAPAQATESGRGLHFQDVGGPAIPRGVVASVLQDSQGQVWVGTGDGLVRFDGQRFRPMERDGVPAAQRNLGWVRALLATRDGRVWIGTESRGLARWDPASGRVLDLPDRRLDAVAQPQILALAEGADGAVWAGTLGGGLERVDPGTGAVQVFRAGDGAAHGLPDNRVFALLADGDGTLWVATGQGLVRRDTSGAFVSAGLPDAVVTRLLRTADGALWAGTAQGALWRTDGSGRWVPAGGPGAGNGRGAVQALLEAVPGELWVGRSDGIDIVDSARAQLLRRVRHDRRKPGGLGGSDVTALWRDREGWVWVGSLGGGLQRHNPQPQALWVRGADADPLSPMHRPDARSLLADHHGRVWVGTHDAGLAVLDAGLRLRHRVSLRPGQAEQPQVQGLAQARDGRVWVAAEGALWQFDPGASAAAAPRLLRRVDGGPARLYRLVAAADGGLWLCAFDGLYHLAAGASAPQRLTRADGTPLQAEVLAAQTGPDGALWVASSVGLHRVPAGSDRLHAVAVDPAAPLAHPTVTGLLWDARGTLWLDTAVAGLHRLLAWDGRQARFDRIGERLGVIGRPFGVNLMADAQGRLWTHLHVYDPAADRLDTLTAADGQHLGTGWFHSHAALPDGRLLFGGARGVLVVEPERHRPKATWPELVLSELSVDDRPLPVPPAALVLRPGQSRFSAEFAALEFSEPARIRYAWRLRGLQEEWVEAGAERRAATYAYLPPGRYTLEARSSNRAGQWNERVLALPVEVLPRWWQRPVVLLGALLLLGVATLALLQWRTAALRARKVALEALVQERTAALEATTEALRRESEAAREASLTDPLTGLRNRRHLLQHIGADVAAALRRWADHRRRDGDAKAAPPDADLVFFLIDIDRFKQVNDRFGHAAGDAVLRQVPARLATVFREADHLVRWGGEEFLVVARGSRRAHAEELAERARRAVADTPFLLDDGEPLACSCSIGFAALPLAPGHPHALDWEDTVRLADAALYRVKAAQRNGWAGVVDAGGLDGAALQRLGAAGWAQALAEGHLPLRQSSPGARPG